MRSPPWLESLCQSESLSFCTGLTRFHLDKSENKEETWNGIIMLDRKFGWTVFLYTRQHFAKKSFYKNKFRRVTALNNARKKPLVMALWKSMIEGLSVNSEGKDDNLHTDVCLFAVICMLSIHTKAISRMCHIFRIKCNWLLLWDSICFFSKIWVLEFSNVTRSGCTELYFFYRWWSNDCQLCRL